MAAANRQVEIENTVTSHNALGQDDAHADYSTLMRTILLLGGAVKRLDRP
jgi:hypothetical protein